MENVNEVLENNEVVEAIGEKANTLDPGNYYGIKLAGFALGWAALGIIGEVAVRKVYRIAYEKFQNHRQKKKGIEAPDVTVISTEEIDE